jgi:hypothetical protein
MVGLTAAAAGVGHNVAVVLVVLLKYAEAWQVWKETSPTGGEQGEQAQNLTGDQILLCMNDLMWLTIHRQARHKRAHRDTYRSRLRGMCTLTGTRFLSH